MFKKGPSNSSSSFFGIFCVSCHQIFLFSSPRRWKESKSMAAAAATTTTSTTAATTAATSTMPPTSERPRTITCDKAAAAPRRREIFNGVSRRRRPSAVDHRPRDVGATHEADNRGLKRPRPARIGARIVPRTDKNRNETDRS